MNEGIKYFNKQELLVAMKDDSIALHYACDDLRDDKEIALEAVKLKGSNILYVSERLQNDKEVVIAGLCSDEPEEAFYFAGIEIRFDKNFILEAMKYAPDAVYFHIDRESRDDEDIIAEYVACKIINTMQDELHSAVKNEEKKEIIKKNIDSILSETFYDEEISKSLNILKKDFKFEKILDKLNRKYFFDLAELINNKIKEHLKKNNIVLENYDYYFRCAVIRDSRAKAWGNFMTIDRHNLRSDFALTYEHYRELYELLEKKELNLKVYTFKNTSNVVLITDNDVEVDEEHCIVSFFNERNVSTQYFDYYDYYYYAYDYTYHDIELKTLEERGEN